jgi:hypothetical protein
MRSLTQDYSLLSTRELTLQIGQDSLHHAFHILLGLSRCGSIGGTQLRSFLLAGRPRSPQIWQMQAPAMINYLGTIRDHTFRAHICHNTCQGAFVVWRTHGNEVLKDVNCLQTIENLLKLAIPPKKETKIESLVLNLALDPTTLPTFQNLPERLRDIFMNVVKRTDLEWLHEPITGEVFESSNHCLARLQALALGQGFAVVTGKVNKQITPR